jgi:GAF domain-containing protein
MKKSRSQQEELERLSRALRTLSGSNRALLRVDDESSLLREICRVVVEEAGYRAGIVGRAEHDERRSITVLAQVSIEETVPDLQALTWADTELGQSATGTAIRTGTPHLINNILTDPLPPFCVNLHASVDSGRCCRCRFASRARSSAR